jgi:peptide/nickel transport system substrate-binding protein
VKRSMYLLITLVALTSFILSACGPAATTVAPATSVPATSVPPTAPAAGPTAPPACVSKGSAAIPFPTGGKTVTVAFQQEPDLVDALFSSMSYAAWVDQSIQVGLGTWDANNNLVPELATEIPSAANGDLSADGLTITWHLKPCLFWSDGQPLTSADVKFTWQLLVDKGNAVYTRAGYDQITSIDTPDDTTAVLHFKTLYPGWATLFDSGPNNQGNIQPEHILKGKTGLEKDPFVHWPTVSSGPWVITEWVAGDHMTLLPNPNYWKGHPKLDQIQIKFVPDSNTAKAALKTGDVDFVPDFAESDLADLPALAPAIVTRVDAGPEFEHYLFNLGSKGTGTGQSDYAGFCPFQDVNVRKAIMLGIDRQTIVNTLLYGKTTVPASLWPNSYWYNTKLTPYPYDKTQAATLLDTAGYKQDTPTSIRHGMCNGVDTKLSFNFETTNKPLREDMAAAVQANLKAIGIEFKPIFTPSGTFFGNYASGADMATGKFDMAGYTTGFYPDPYTDGFLCSTVQSAQNPGGDNNYHICDPALDKIMQASNTSADPAVRKTAIDQAQQYMYDNVLVIPMYARANVMAYLARFVLPPTSVIGGMMGDTFDWDVK